MPFTRIIADFGNPAVGSHRYRSGNSWYDFASPKGKADNTSLLRSIVSKYGDLVAAFADALAIPRGIVVSFIATESGGKMVTRPGSAFKGLMQCAAGPFYDAIVKWGAEVKGVSIPDKVRNEIAAKCPELLRHSLTNYKPSALSGKIAQLMQQDAAFNIMAGCVILRWNLERFGGSLNKAIIAYNAGPYNKAISNGTRAIATPTDTSALVQSPGLAPESREYLRKMMGVGSYCALIYQEKTVNV